MAINIKSTTPMFGLLIETDGALLMRVWMMHSSEEDAFAWLSASADGTKWSRLSAAEVKQMDYELLLQAVELPTASLWSRIMTWLHAHIGSAP